MFFSVLIFKMAAKIGKMTIKISKVYNNNYYYYGHCGYTTDNFWNCSRISEVMNYNQVRIKFHESSIFPKWQLKFRPTKSCLIADSIVYIVQIHFSKSILLQKSIL